MKGAVSMAKSTPHYRMSICPPVVVHNLLPYSLNLSLQVSNSLFQGMSGKVNTDKSKSLLELNVV